MSEMDDDKFELCKDCEYCVWDCFEGHSTKECGLPAAKQWFIDGCKEDCVPYYDEEEECWTCNSYKMHEEF